VIGRFGLREAGTSVGREVLGGVSTFAALSYILFVQPAVLSHPACGMDPGGVLFATCVASALACFAMGLVANYPIALAPGMGVNFFFVFALCAGRGLTWQQALAANLLAGVLFLVVSATPLRERLIEALPIGLQRAIAAGIGLLVALVGLQWGGIVVDDPATLVRLGDLSHPVALLALFGLAVGAVLTARGVPAAALVAIGCTAAAGFVASEVLDLERPLVHVGGVVSAPTSPAGTAFELDFTGLFALPLADWLAIVLVLLAVDLFDSLGTLVGVAERAGLMRDGRLPRARRALAADAIGTVTGAALGTSTVTSYVESAAGVAAGGRTGLSACVTGVLILGGLFFTPLYEAVGAGIDVAPAGAAEPLLRYPVLAPVLILVGAMMATALSGIEWKDPVEGLPAFLCVLVMPLSLSITEGLAWGVMARSGLGLATRRPTAGALHVLAVFFVLRAVFLR
jgi:AGZA family xanthine/uracil permease-like MFS transporter